MKMERFPGDEEWVYNLQNSLAKFSRLQRELTSKKPPEMLHGLETIELLPKLMKKIQNRLELCQMPKNKMTTENSLLVICFLILFFILKVSD